MWPELPYEQWNDTLDTLHLYTQIVGKLKLELAPFISQWWEVALYITPTGLTTGHIPYEGGAFEVDFDFLSHALSIRTSSGKSKTIALAPRAVADFYNTFMKALRSLGIRVVINPIPVEIPAPIRFQEDTGHASYNPEYVTRWWRILLQSTLLFDRFRSSFRGKNSPHQFFWGSFDLSGTRFSGRRAKPPKIDGQLKNIMKYAENEENFAYGFWPGDQRYPNPAYYVYMYPQPRGFESVKFGKSASYNESLAECILAYDKVRESSFPEKVLLDFLTHTYTESARLARWDVKSLEAITPPLRLMP